MFCCSLNCILSLSPHTHAHTHTHLSLSLHTHLHPPLTKHTHTPLSLSLKKISDTSPPPPHKTHTHTYLSFSLSLSISITLSLSLSISTPPPTHKAHTHTLAGICACTHACAFEISRNFLQCKLWCFVCNYIEWIDGLELLFRAIQSCQSFRDKFFHCIFHCYLFGSLYQCQCVSSTLCFLPRSVLFPVPLRVVVIHLYQ